MNDENKPLTTMQDRNDPEWREIIHRFWQPAPTAKAARLVARRTVEANKGEHGNDAETAEAARA